ncbi:MAG: transglutaminase family protein [Solirubrobacterales bacterium]|nr:transglutaminase family protein [Solirubrobacterales bacterium]
MTPVSETNFEIRYLSRYSYDQDVVDNLNALRVKPATLPRQRVEEFSVRLSPDARQQRHDDYFGTEVVEFEIARPHHELVIDVRARVTTQAPEAPPQPDWEALEAPEYLEAGGEFLFHTEDVTGHPALDGLLAETAQSGTPVELLTSVAELIPSRFEYRRGATYVDSPLAAVLDGGAGVCQDFVHLALWLLRHHGIAARYVSGYLFSSDGSAPEQESVEVDTHAWLEALVPNSRGDSVWVGVDPTNQGLTTGQHVKIGHGRHYSDVPPIKGVYRGMAESSLDASVTMTRLEGPDPAASART